MDSTKRKLLTIVVVSLLLLFSIFYIAAISSYWKITPDSATYVFAGESLAVGEGYMEKGKPVELFPPMTSLIFSVFILIFPGSYFALNAVVTVFVFLSLFLCFILLLFNDKHH